MKRRPPFIGITPDWTGGQPGKAREPIMFLSERYVAAVTQAGATPLVLPLLRSPPAIRQVLERLDGLVITGGNFDIHPRLYGEPPLPQLGEIKEDRTEFEIELISQALKRDMPVLGICGGAQAINVALGGSLYQDLSLQLPAAIQHQQSEKKETGGHFVSIPEGTLLRRIVGRAFLEVNTTHHQAVKKLGKGLVENAIAEDSVTEGLESIAHRFIVGIQWHPEFLVHKDAGHKKIFSAFVSACRGFRS
jgi:putative glutamine amidotransferase